MFDHVEKWEKKDVEPHALQRFAARLLCAFKRFGIICSVDHAIFQQEMGRIHLLEMDMVGSLNVTNDKTSLEKARQRANELLLKVFDSGANERLERTLQGTTWMYGHNEASTSLVDDVFATASDIPGMVALKSFLLV